MPQSLAALVKSSFPRTLALSLVVVVLGSLAMTPAQAAVTGVTVPGQSPATYVMWTKCADVVAMTDADLTKWHTNGVDGFVCNMGWLRGMGGTQDFTADPSAALSTSNYTLQKSIRDTKIVARAAAHGIRLYLGVYFVNYNNTATPLKNWFDDSGWANVVVPRMREVAGAAKMLGFAGLAFDEELYYQQGGVKTATWSWSFPGNTHTQAEVRAKAKQRGQQLMSTIVAAFPSVTIIDYGSRLPETWSENVQLSTNKIVNAYAALLHIDFWDGLTSAPGYGDIEFLDQVFYKSTQVAGASWDNAFTYEMNRFYAMLSRRLSNFAYASSRIGRVPFSWINSGTSTYEQALPPLKVAAQYAAIRRWTSGSVMADYVYGSIKTFNYDAYVPTMQAASATGVVDSSAPVITSTTPLGTGGTIRATSKSITLTGGAKDDFAIQSVSWTNTATGATGAAAMTWRVVSGSATTSYVWSMDWSVTAAGLVTGTNPIKLTATDIHGLTTSVTVTVTAP